MTFLFPIIFSVVVLALLPPDTSIHAADLKTVGGITAFAGAEGAGSGSAVGGVDGLGLIPLTKNLGLQGGLTFSGGQGFRLGLNAGPVLNFDSGKLGLFTDYEYFAREDYNYVGIRGMGAYYFNQFDGILSYSQPVSSIHRDGGRKLTSINELHGILRFYPTTEVELNGGILVNSFAGPGRKDNGGTGVGGSFGVSFKLWEPIVLQLVQAKIDNRDRYRVTSGIQVIWGSPLKDYLREQLSSPTIGASSGGTPKSSNRSRSSSEGEGDRR